MTGVLPAPTARGKALLHDLARLDVAASCDPADLWAMSRDSWPRAMLWTKAGLAPHPPDVVAWPANVEQVAAVVKLAAERQVPVVPFGGGSGVCGGVVPVHGGIALDLKKLVNPLRIDLAARTVETGAGIIGQRLEELLEAEGATLGHAPPSIRSATVGGWLATRSAGQLSSRYGKIEDMVLSLEAVDGTGAVLRTLEGPSAGPDLLQLLIGSEGTLAVITSARLRIWPKPRFRWLRAVRFRSLPHGMRALHSLMRSGLRPAIARLHDPVDTLLAGLPATPLDVPLRVALHAPLLLNRLVDALPSDSLLILGFEGESEEDCAEEGAAALILCEAEDGEDLGPSPGERWFENRFRSSYGASPLFSAGAFVDTLDVATTWDRLDGLHRAVRRALSGLAFVRANFTHAYLEGCAVEFTFVGLALEEAESRYSACWTAALSAAADEGATISHHRGVGIARQATLSREHGEGMRQLRALKKAFDPHGVLNPGKLLL